LTLFSTPFILEILSSGEPALQSVLPRVSRYEVGGAGGA